MVLLVGGLTSRSPLGLLKKRLKGILSLCNIDYVDIHRPLEPSGISLDLKSASSRNTSICTLVTVLDRRQSQSFVLFLAHDCWGRPTKIYLWGLIGSEWVSVDLIASYYILLHLST